MHKLWLAGSHLTPSKNQGAATAHTHCENMDRLLRAAFGLLRRRTAKENRAVETGDEGAPLDHRGDGGVDGQGGAGRCLCLELIVSRILFHAVPLPVPGHRPAAIPFTTPYPKAPRGSTISLIAAEPLTELRTRRGRSAPSALLSSSCRGPWCDACRPCNEERLRWGVLFLSP